MSYQRGNVNRSRPQRHQNSHTFKNTLHDTSSRTKKINTIQVVNVCERCKKIIEWKIKYKKYKPLKTPGTCTKCEEKCVMHAYHNMCGSCALQHEVCPKCGEKRQIIKQVTQDEPIKLDRELRLLFKTLPERKRRTFMRYMNKKDGEKKKMKNCPEDSEKTPNEDAVGIETFESTEAHHPYSRDDLLNKLKSLMLGSESVDETRDGTSDSTEEDSDSNSGNES